MAKHRSKRVSIYDLTTFPVCPIHNRVLVTYCTRIRSGIKTQYRKCPLCEVTGKTSIRMNSERKSP